MYTDSSGGANDSVGHARGHASKVARDGSPRRMRSLRPRAIPLLLVSSVITSGRSSCCRRFMMIGIKGGPLYRHHGHTLGRDTLRGDEGNDILKGGGWIDSLDGGEGNDDRCSTIPGEVRINCERGIFGI